MRNWIQHVVPSGRAHGRSATLLLACLFAVLWVNCVEANSVILRASIRRCLKTHCEVAEATATAFPIARCRGYLYWVTAGHVVDLEPGEQMVQIGIEATQPNGKKGLVKLSRQFFIHDNTGDIALLRSKDYPSVKLVRVAPVPPVGSRVLIYGYRNGKHPIISVKATITQRKPLRYTSDGRTGGGMSGSPVYFRGNVIGVHNGSFDPEGENRKSATGLEQYRKRFLRQEDCYNTQPPLTTIPQRKPIVTPVRPSNTTAVTVPQPCYCSAKIAALEQQIRALAMAQKEHRGQQKELERLHRINNGLIASRWEETERNIERIAKLETLAEQLKQHLKNNSSTEPDAYTRGQLVKLAAEIDKLKHRKPERGPRGDRGPAGRDGKDLVLSPDQVNEIVSRMLKVQVKVQNQK